MHEATDSTDCKPADRSMYGPLPCTDTLVTLLVTGERTAGRFALVEAVERRGAAHPLHVHSREDELIYVLQGQVRFHQDGAWFERRAGESVLLPKGHEHTYVVGSAGARLLVVLVPAGLEDYYRELVQPAGGPCAYQDAERLVVVAARYGVDITGPPPALKSQSQP